MVLAGDAERWEATDGRLMYRAAPAA
jgi:hypothetical protein